ncbi:MAG: hypothetical protein IKB16_00030 [Lentisphaeria bacterium]|nr:hypothetical protein [Lentisphaeria bacterium]
MKKMLSILFMTAVAGSVFAQQSALKPITGVNLDRNTKLPVHWLIQGQPADKATVKTIVDQNGKSKSITFAPVKSRLDFFGNAMTFEKGDEFTIKVKIKGTGKVALAYMGYRTDNKFLFSSTSKPIVLTGEVQELTQKFVVKDGKDYPTAKIRTAIRMDKGTVCEITDFTLTEE